MDYKEYYNQNAEEYAKKYGIVHADILDRFLRTISVGGSILDIGCGPGQDVDYFTKKGYTAIGIDIARGMIEYAKKHHQGVFILGDSYESAFKPGAFNAVWSASSIFTHLKKRDRQKVFGRISQLLQTGGALGVIVRRKTQRRKGFYSYSEEEVLFEIGRYGFLIEETRVFSQGETEWIFVLAQKVAE